MLNKLKTILIAIMLLIALPMYAFAENDTADVAVAVTTSVEVEGDETTVAVTTSAEVEGTDVVDETDAIILKDINGAKVRVMQLVRKVKHQIDDGNLIVDYLVENTDVDTTELSEIITDLEGILVEIEEFDPTGKTAQELAEAYTSIKAEAIELSNSFKGVASASLNEEQRKELREIIKARNDERKSEKNDNIENLKLQYNKQKAKEIVQRLGFDSQELRDQFESGDLSIDDIKKRVLGEFRNLNETQRENFVVKMREENQKIKVEARQREGELKAKYENKIRDLEMKLREREDRFEMRVREGDSEFRLRDGDDKFEMRMKNGSQDLRVKVKDDRFEVRDGKNIRIEERDDGRLKLEFRDRPGVAINEISNLIERKRANIERLSNEEGSEDRIDKLEVQISHLEDAIEKIESHKDTIKKIKIEEDSDGELEIEIETEDEDFEYDSDDKEDESDEDEEEHEDEDEDEHEDEDEDEDEDEHEDDDEDKDDE